MREIAFLVILVVEIAYRCLVDLHRGVPHDRGGRLFKVSFLIIGLENASYRLRIHKVLMLASNNIWGDHLNPSALGSPIREERYYQVGA